MSRQHATRFGSDPTFDQPGGFPHGHLGDRPPLVQEPDTSNQVADIITIIAATAWNSKLDRLAGNQRLGYILECLVRAQQANNPPPPPEDPSHHPISQIHSIIINQIASIQTAADIAKRLGVSVSTLDKKYQKLTNQTPMSFVRRYRLAETARLLQYSQISLGEIAERVGFRNSKALYKAWRTVYDLPPRQWRLQHSQPD